MKKTSFEDALILKTVKAARLLARALPLAVSLRLARAVGYLLYYSSKRRGIAYRNLRAAFAAEKSPAELKRIARRSFGNLAMSVVELLRFPDMDEDYVRRHVSVSGQRKIGRSGRGLIFLTAHFGNWELLNIAGTLLGYPMVALARVQKHPRADEYLNRLRASKGTQIIRKGMPIREIIKALRQGKIVGLLSDQDAGKNGVFVNFFGRLSSTPSGVVTFSLRTGAAIFPVFIFREGLQKHRIEVEGPLEVPAASSPEQAEQNLLQQFCSLLEAKIRKSPEQWLWAHRRWKSTPDRFVLVLSDGKAGHLNQSLAVVRAASEERQNVHCRVIEVRFKSAARRRLLQALLIVTRGRLPFMRRWLRLCLTGQCLEQISTRYADLVVSCGASVLAANLYAKQLNRARSVIVMKPSVPPARFDLVIAPRHDKMNPSKNVFITDGALQSITPADLEAQSAKLRTELNGAVWRTKIGVLVGGDTADFKFEPEMFENSLKGLLGYAAETDAALLVTTSRRTPRWAEQVLRQRLGDSGRCPLLVLANESNRDGIVPGILGLSDALVVSGESISMVSEAVASGKPVTVFIPAKPARLKPKHENFLRALERQGRLVRALPGKMAEALAQSFSTRSQDARVSDADVRALRNAVQKVIQ